MAVDRRTSRAVKPVRLSASATYKIGGRNYNSQDVSRFRPQTKEVTTVSGMENAPRQVGKNLENQSGVIHTDAVSPSANVHSQTEAYKPSVNTQATVQVATTPQSTSYKPSESTPIYSTPSMTKQPDMSRVQTESELYRKAESRVQTQTEYYYSNNAHSSENTNISSGIDSSPRMVGAIKTSSLAKENGMVQIPVAQTSEKIKTDVLNTQIKGEYRPNIPTVGTTENIQISLTPQQMADFKATTVRMGATSNLTTGNIQYGENVTRAFTLTDSAKNALRAEKILGNNFASGKESNREFIRGLGAVASYSIKTETVNALQQWKEAPKGIGFLNGGTLLLGKAESGLLSDDDFATQSAGAVIAAGTMGVEGFKMTQQFIEVGIEGVKRVGNGIYQVSTTAGTAGITVGRTAKTLIDRQIMPVSKEAVSILRNQAAVSGLNNTQIAKNIVNKVNNVRDTYHNAISSIKQTKNSLKSGARTIKTAVDKSVKIVHGVATGTLTMNMATANLQAFKNRAFRGIKTGIKTGIRTSAGMVVKGTATGTTRLVMRGVPKAGHLLDGGLVTAAGMLSGSDDWAVQGVGNAIATTEIGVKVGVKTAVTGVKATGYTVKTAVKGGKAAYAGMQFVRNQGLRAAWQRARVKAVQKIYEAGKSLVSVLITGAKLLGSKVVIPLLLICIIGTAVMGGISAPVMAVGTIFSGIFTTSDTNTEHNIRDYMLEADAIPKYSLEYKQNLANQMANAQVQNGGGYHVVRFYSNTGSADVIEPTLQGITSVFPTDEELVNMLQPMFNALILMEYELEPTEAEAKTMIEELFNGLFRITTATSVEQCGQALRDGVGTVTVHECGEVHAFDDCPNFIEGIHTDYTCEECDYYTCEGHKGEKKCGKSSHSHSESCYNATGQKICGMSEHSHDSWNSADDNGCYETDYHEGKLDYDCGNAEFECDGFKNCNSHQVISYTLNLDGVYALTNKYFLEPIDQLSNINPRTQEQEEQLQNLKDYYDIFQELMGQIAQEYGGGLSMSDLSGVEFVNGTRTGNQSVVDLALSQVGQQGGQPYWSYYGFQSRVEWCACFVNWCMRNTSSASGSYPTTSNNAYCPTLASHFQSTGQWGNKDYTNLVAGDVIFFDWEGDGVTDHVGIVIGQDGNYVYTVEGNSGDAVKAKQYQIGSSVIFGYGLMNY